MSGTVLPIALWYGGLAGVGLATLLVLWAIGLYAIKRATGSFPAVLVLVALLAFAVAGWAMIRATGLNQENQLLKVRGPLNQLMASGVAAREAIDDVRGAAEPSPELTALLGTFDDHDASIDLLLQAEWEYHRAGPWNERALLLKSTWDVNDIRVHHARWEKRTEALECPATPPLPALSELDERLRTRLQTHRVNAGAVGEQFDGFDLDRVSQWSDAAIIRACATLLAVLALVAAGAVFVVRRQRPWQSMDALVTVAALVLAGVGGWLALGAGAEQERLRARLFGEASSVYREAIDLNEAVSTLMLASRTGLGEPRVRTDTLIAEYAEYLNTVQGLTQLLRIWDRFVLTGVLDTGLVSSERIRTHDDLLNAVRTGTLRLQRQYLQLDRRVTDLSCRSEWFPRSSGRTLEDELVTLPSAP